MKTLILEKFPRILKNKRHLEKSLNVKISNRGKEVSVDGEAEDEYIAELIFLALEFGFPFSTAMLIKYDDYMFETIPIKSVSNKKNMANIKARIIGTGGKTLQTLTTLTNCFYELKDNEVGIIGPPELMKTAQTALTSLIKGAKTANVYSFLEKHQPQPIDDLGLINEKKKRR